MGDTFGVLVGVKKRCAKASTVRMRSVLVGVGESSPVLGIMRRGSISLGWDARVMMNGKKKAMPHAAITTKKSMNPLFFRFNPVLHVQN